MIVAIRHKKIRKRLARKNMSQTCFALRLGVSSCYMSQLISGVRNPSPGLREKILAELKMDESGFDEIFFVLKKSFEGKKLLHDRKHFRPFMKEINSIGGVQLLDYLDVKSLTKIFEEIIDNTLKLNEI